MPLIGKNSPSQPFFLRKQPLKRLRLLSSFLIGVIRRPNFEQQLFDEN